MTDENEYLLFLYENKIEIRHVQGNDKGNCVNTLVAQSSEGLDDGSTYMWSMDNVLRMIDRHKELYHSIKGEQVQIKLNGKSIRCDECKASVFTKISENRYVCNGCGEEYEGTPKND